MAAAAAAAKKIVFSFPLSLSLSFRWKLPFMAPHSPHFSPKKLQLHWGSVKYQILLSLLWLYKFSVGLDVAYFLASYIYSSFLSLFLVLSPRRRRRHAIIPLAWPFPPHRACAAAAA